MSGSGTAPFALLGDAPVAQVSQNPVEVFNTLFTAFLVLGTLVGTVVVSYTLYNAYKYRASASEAEGEYDIRESATDGGDDEDSVARPSIGEIPTGKGKGGGKKLFLSFSLSAIIVLGLVIFAYSMLLQVEGAPDNEDALEVGVEANQYKYTYTYPSGATSNELVVPKGRVIELNVTSCHPSNCPEESGSGNVWHSWTSPDLKASADAIPGQYTQTWFQTNETGEYLVQCRELCGPGHSTMRFDEGIDVRTTENFKEWCDDNNCMTKDNLNDWLDQSGDN